MPVAKKQTKTVSKPKEPVKVADKVKEEPVKVEEKVKKTSPKKKYSVGEEFITADGKMAKVYKIKNESYYVFLDGRCSKIKI